MKILVVLLILTIIVLSILLYKNRSIKFKGHFLKSSKVDVKERNWDFIEKAVYINLDHRKDRRQEIEKEMKGRIPSNKVIRLSAIKDNPGSIGCTRSHIKVIEMAIQNNWKNVLVIEDDAMFHKYDTGYDTLEWIFDEHPDFDVITLGNVKADFDKSTLKLRSGQTTTAYIVNKHYYQKLLENFKYGLSQLLKVRHLSDQERLPYSQKYCIDIYWKNLQKTDNWYIVNPALMIQRPSNSSIEGSYKDYTSRFNL